MEGRALSADRAFFDGRIILFEFVLQYDYDRERNILAQWGSKQLRSRIYGYGIAGVLVVVLVFLIMGMGNREQITLAEDKVITVQVWGVGLEGAVLPKEEAQRLAGLVNGAQNYREKTCCTNEGMPASRALIHLAADDVAVSYWGPELLAVSHQFGTYWVEQPELETYMRELAEFK